MARPAIRPVRMPAWSLYGRQALTARAAGWMVAILVAWGMFLSAAMVNPTLHHLIDGDTPNAAAASISPGSAKSLALAVHGVGGNASETKAPAGMICSGHCAAHFAGTLPPSVAVGSENPILIAWPWDEARLQAAWQPFSLDRPPRV